MGRYHSVNGLIALWSVHNNSNIVCMQIHAAAWQPCVQTWAEKQKKTERERGQETQTVSGPPRENATGKQRFVYILLTHSKSLDPDIIPWGSPPHSHFEPIHVVVQSRPEQEMHRPIKIYNSKPWLFSSVLSVHNTHREKEDQQDVFCSPSGRVCLALIRSSRQKRKTYTVLIPEEQHSRMIFHWHQRLAKIIARNAREWCIQSAIFLR